ncbi:MAG TPA: TIGR03435 family protein [Verrucomicrobiae bacterium]|jgi:uncharacterized protein (TIGR03435 family)
MTKAIVLIVAVVWVLAMVVAIKLAYFPSAKDAYFAMDERSLQRAPAGLVLIRPTHFSPAVFRRGVVRGQSRIMGREVSLRDMIAVAWQVDAARVAMPPGAPTNNFDFIVTVGEPRKQLQKAIRNLFGYSADKETIETEVLALKVEDPALPGLTVSTESEKEGTDFKKGRIYITHMRLKELTGEFEQILKAPVVDETSLTNCYDFSVAWNAQILMRLSRESTARPALDKLLGSWGLGFEPDTASLEMLVVKKQY